MQIVAMVATLDVSELQRREDGLLEDCLAHLEDSLQDPSYAARRHAALTVPSLYTRLAGRFKHPSGTPAEVVRAPSLKSAHTAMMQTLPSMCGLPGTREFCDTDSAHPTDFVMALHACHAGVVHAAGVKSAHPSLGP